MYTRLSFSCIKLRFIRTICILQGFDASTEITPLRAFCTNECVFWTVFFTFCVLRFCILCRLVGRCTAVFNIYNGFIDLWQRFLHKTVLLTKTKADRVFLRPALKPKRDVYNVFYNACVFDAGYKKQSNQARTTKPKRMMFTIALHSACNAFLIFCILCHLLKKVFCVLRLHIYIRFFLQKKWYKSL